MLKCYSQYKSRQGVIDDDASLPDRLNNFFACFEAPNLITRGRAGPSPPSIMPALKINAADTCRTLTRVNPWKAGGPDNILGHVLRTCALWASRCPDWHLQHLPQSGHCPQMLQNIHYHTRSKELSCNISEWLMPRRTDTNCDEVFWATCQTTHHGQPPCITWLAPVCLSSQLLHRGYNIHHTVINHLNQKDTYTRILYIDFFYIETNGEATPTRPEHRHMSLDPVPSYIENSVCLVGNNTSNSIPLSSGSPQGCVLSPLLSTLLTHDSAPRHKGNQIIKFAYDTTLVGLIHKNEESMYREEVKHLEG